MGFIAYEVLVLFFQSEFDPGLETRDPQVKELASSKEKHPTEWQVSTKQRRKSIEHPRLYVRHPYSIACILDYSAGLRIAMQTHLSEHLCRTRLAARPASHKSLIAEPTVEAG